jgi:hypothetical protein
MLQSYHEHGISTPGIEIGSTVPFSAGDRLAFALHSAGLWPYSRAVVLCRPDAWGRVSFAATPVSIVGWIYDPDHSFVVSTYGFLIERNRAFACAATTRSRLRRSRVDLASRSRRFKISTSTGSSRIAPEKPRNHRDCDHAF